MSGECDKCGEHCLVCQCTKRKITIYTHHLEGLSSPFFDKEKIIPEKDRGGTKFLIARDPSKFAPKGHSPRFMQNHTSNLAMTMQEHEIPTEKKELDKALKRMKANFKKYKKENKKSSK